MRLLADALNLDAAVRSRLEHAARAYLRPEPAGTVTTGPASIASAVPRQLPTLAAHLVGRTAELDVLTGLAKECAEGLSQTAVISAISGPPGVGKTALAVHFGRQAARSFPDGQLYVDLAGFGPAGSPLAPGQAMRGFLDALGVRPEQIPGGLDGQAGLYRSLLAGRRMLVVLDNAADEQQVRPLLPGSPGSLAVVTSRRQLAGLAVAEGAALVTLSCLPQAEAVHLLAVRLGAGRVAAEPGAAADLVTLCGGLPLALAILAARGAVRPGFPLAELAAELRQPGSCLDALDAGAAEAGIRPVFSWSCQALSQPALAMFRLLGLHPGPEVSVAAAASLADADHLAVRVPLNELTRASLLTEHLPGRYTQPDLLRVYASEQAAALDGGERQAAADRLLDHYLHTAHAAAMALRPARGLTLGQPAAGTRPERPAGHQQAMDWFAAEHQVLLTLASRAAATGADSYAWQLPWAMAIYLDRQGLWADLAATQLTALAAAQRLGEVAGQAQLHRNIGHARFRLGSHDDARAHLSLAMRLYRQLGDKASQGRIHIDLMIISEHRGFSRAHLRHARQARRLFQEAGDPSMAATALNAIGWSRAHLGDQVHALDACQQALDLARRAGDSALQACAWDSLGYIRGQLGQHDQAIACYQNSVRIRQQTGERYGQAVTLARLGDAWHGVGDLTAARGAWRDALALLDQLGHHDAAQIRAKLRG